MVRCTTKKGDEVSAGREARRGIGGGGRAVQVKEKRQYQEGTKLGKEVSMKELVRENKERKGGGGSIKQ